jgi:hypothetical protein
LESDTCSRLSPTARSISFNLMPVSPMKYSPWRDSQYPCASPTRRICEPGTNEGGTKSHVTHGHWAQPSPWSRNRFGNVGVVRLARAGTPLRRQVSLSSPGLTAPGSGLAPSPMWGPDLPASGSGASIRCPNLAAPGAALLSPPVVGPDMSRIRQRCVLVHRGSEGVLVPSDSDRPDMSRTRQRSNHKSGYLPHPAAGQSPLLRVPLQHPAAVLAFVLGVRISSASGSRVSPGMHCGSDEIRRRRQRTHGADGRSG